MPVDGGYRVISQSISTDSYIHELSFATTFKKNTSDLYLSNTFNLNAGWNHDVGLAATTGSVSDTRTDVSQHFDNPSFAVEDKIHLVRNTDRNALEAVFTIGWNHRPVSLSVSPGDFFGDSSDGRDVLQTYTGDNIKASFNTGRIYKFGRFNVNASVFADADIENVVSDLTGILISPGSSGCNDYLFGKFLAGFSSYVDYSFRDFYCKLTLPVGYNRQWLTDRLESRRAHSWNYVDFNPALHLTYSFGRGWFTFDAFYNKTRNNASKAASGIVMADYLSFRQSAIERTLVDKSFYSSFSYRYTNALLQLFGNMSLSWMREDHNSMFGTEYDGFTSVSVAMPLPYDSDTYSLSGNVSKGFGFWGAVAKLTGNASVRNSSLLIDRDLFDYTSRFWSTNLVISAMPAGWLGCALGFGYSEGRTHTEISDGRNPVVRQGSGRIDLNFYPKSNLIVNVAAEDNYTNLTAGGRHAWFGDAKVILKQRRFDWELEFNNIFNRKEFTRVSYSDMNIYSSSYLLRERNVLLKLRFSLR